MWILRAVWFWRFLVRIHWSVTADSVWAYMYTTICYRRLRSRRIKSLRRVLTCPMWGGGGTLILPDKNFFFFSLEKVGGHWKTNSNIWTHLLSLTYVFYILYCWLWYEGWNFNFGNTPLDWIQELLEWRANAAGRMDPFPTYIHNGSVPSRNGHTQ